MPDSNIGTPAPVIPNQTQVKPQSQVPVSSSTPASKPGNTQTTQAKPPVSTPAEPNSKHNELIEYTVHGKQKKLTIAEAITKLQKDEASAQNFEQAAQLMKKNKAFAEALQGDGAADALKEVLGEERFYDIARSVLSGQIQHEMLSPEQQEMQRIQRELEGYRSKEAQEHQQRQEAEEKANFDRHIQHFDTIIEGMADKYQIPKNPATLNTIVETMLEALDLQEQGIVLTEEQVAMEAKARLSNHSRERDNQIASGLGGEDLLNYLGDNTIKAVITALSARSKNTNPYSTNTPRKPANQGNNGSPANTGKMSPEDYKKWMESKYGIKI